MSLPDTNVSSGICEYLFSYRFKLFGFDTEFFFDFLFRDVFGCADAGEAFDVFMSNKVKPTDWCIESWQIYADVTYRFKIEEPEKFDTLDDFVALLETLEAEFVERFELADEYKHWQRMREYEKEQTDTSNRLSEIFRYLAWRRLRNHSTYQAMMEAQCMGSAYF